MSVSRAPSLVISLAFALVVAGCGGSEPSLQKTADAPSQVTATAGDALATVAWHPSAHNGGVAITYYIVTASPGGASASTPDGKTTTATVTGLTNGTRYTFTVVAANAVGVSPPSAPSNAVTPMGVPGAPTSVNAVAGDGQLKVTFAAPFTDGGWASPTT